MILSALSRLSIEALHADLWAREPAIAICIAYPKGRLHRLEPQGQLLEVLHLRFSDCDGEGRFRFPDRKEPGARGVPMTEAQALEVADFVLARPAGIVAIYAACYGGVSRSTGLLQGIGLANGWPTEQTVAGRDPNPHVRELVVNAFRRRRGEV